MISAAMGLAKGSPNEQQALPQLAALTMTSFTIPTRQPSPWTHTPQDLPLLRLEDFHTVLNTRRASGKMNEDPVVTRRHYLLDARFGVIFEGDRTLLEQVAAALRDPAWGVWLGRKSCIPASPILRGLFTTLGDAQRALIGNALPHSFTTVADVTHFEEGTDSLNDTPLSFGDPHSSGVDQRRFALRRIRVTPASSESPESPA
jgi:CRISPR system Cascade subunit CasD